MNTAYKAVLEEIRKEADGKRTGTGIPEFSQIPYRKESETTVYTLWNEIDRKAEDLFIPPVYEETGGNALKRKYTSLISKVTRCVTFPLTKKVTDANRSMQDSMMKLVRVTEQQQWEINRLKRQIEQMENARKEETEE